MRLRKIVLLSGIFVTALAAATACNRNTSISDIPSVEEKGTISQELINQMNISNQGNLDQIEGKDFILTNYLDDSHFYQDMATVNWWAQTKQVSVQISLNNSFSASDPSEGGEYFSLSEEMVKKVSDMKRGG